MEDYPAARESQEDHRRPSSPHNDAVINNILNEQENNHTQVDGYKQMGYAQANNYTQANEDAQTNKYTRTNEYEYQQSYTNRYEYKEKSIYESPDTFNIRSDNDGNSMTLNDSDLEEPQVMVSRGFAGHRDEGEESDGSAEQVVWTLKGKRSASHWKGKGVNRRG
ncbi:hypothetical protein BDV93DRAFT_509259 [Ceratobasidium sp. AG-I]|nr:hypothetical protein BDV93DRAFT_509259 [Ceratobasidium sp. AG-I]